MKISIPAQQGRYGTKIKTMLNLIACGEVFDYTIPASTTIASGDPVLIGDVLGIAVTGSSTEGDVIAVQVEGVFEITKRAHASTAAIAQGAKVYWDVSASKIDNTPNGGTNKAIGVAYKAAASTDTTVQVSLEPSVTGQAAVVAPLTDNSTGSATGTLAAITSSTPADLAAVGAQLVIIKNAIASLAAKQAAVLTALKDAGIMASA